DFVKRGNTPEVIALFEEQPHHMRNTVWLTHRITHCYPGAPLDSVHYEASTIFVEQQRVVLQVHQIRVGSVLAANDRSCGSQFRIRWGCGFMRGVCDETSYCENDNGHQ